MGDSLRDQIKTIKMDVDRIGKQFSKEVSKYVVEDLTTTFRQIVDDFYSAYPDPDRYVRTHNLYNAILPQNPIEKGKGYRSGIVVGSFNMFDNYDISPDNVFDLFWNKGVRGLPKIGTRILESTGETWKNPTWISQYGERENVFRTQVSLGTHMSIIGTPHQVMKDITEHWGDAKGILACDEVYRNLKI